MATVALVAALTVMALVQIAPVHAEPTDTVTVLDFHDAGIVVQGPRYTASINWVEGEGPKLTDTPTFGTVDTGHGQSIGFRHQLTQTAAAGALANPMEQDLQGQPGTYQTTLLNARLSEVQPAKVTVDLKFAMVPVDTTYQGIEGDVSFTFRPGWIEHAYGFRVPSVLMPIVHSNVTLDFGEAQPAWLSVHPSGAAVVDNGESLDEYATWQANQTYGVLYENASRPHGFDLHRVFSDHYTNYLRAGSMRAYETEVWQRTNFNFLGWQPFNDHDVSVTDFWHFPPTGTTPIELAAMYQQLVADPGGGGGGGGEPAPPNDASVWPLRCPDLPVGPTGGACDKRVVVAVVDSGINPYHSWFRRPGWTTHPSAFVAGFPSAAPSLSLTFGGDLDDNLLADTATWANVERDALYTIPGTNVIGAISFGEQGSGGPVQDDTGHGTGTAGAVTTVAPDALVVIVEVSPSDGSMDEGLAWVAEQEWIDVVTVSYGTAANMGPLSRPAGLSNSVPEPYTRLMHDAGKLVFAAAGNDGTLSATDYYDGPPWVVSVGGASTRTNTSFTLTAHGMDVVSDHNQTLPRHESVYGLGQMKGTSFSSPRAAGALAEGILQSRITHGHTDGIVAGALVVGSGSGAFADGRATHDEFREAMNRTARYVVSEGMGRPDTIESPALPVAPWLRQGWGHVGPDRVSDIVAVVEGHVAPPTHEPAAVAYMDALYRARVAFWEDSYPLWNPVLQPVGG